jgi:type IV secretory pathway VirB4 component
MDLVPWDLFVDEGLLLHVDGALSASFRFRGPDPASSTEEELVGLSRSLGQALRPMGDGWMLHVDLHRVPAPAYPEAGAFPDRFTRALDEERRRRYEGRLRPYEGHRSHFVNEQYLTVTHHPGVGDGGAAESAFRQLWNIPAGAYRVLSGGQTPAASRRRAGRAKGAPGDSPTNNEVDDGQ